MRADLTPIWKGLSEFDNSYAVDTDRKLNVHKTFNLRPVSTEYAQLWCDTPFLCNYYCSKWYQTRWIWNWLVKKNNFGEATFWVRYFFRTFLTFVNCEGPYFTEGFLLNLSKMFRYCVRATRSHHKKKEYVCSNSSWFGALLNYKLRN